MRAGLRNLRMFNKWSLFCERRNLELHHLSKSELQLVLLTLTSTEKSQTYLYRRGWPGWLGLKDSGFQILPDHPHWFQNPRGLTPPPELSHLHDMTQMKLAAKVYRDRHHERHSIKLPIQIASHQRQFETFTLDVSEGGILVRDALPEWAAGYLYCVIEAAGDQQIGLICSLVEDQEHQKTRLEVVTTQSQSEFLTWLRSDLRFKKAAGAP